MASRTRSDRPRGRSRLDRLADLCYPVYERLVDSHRGFVDDIDRKLDQALREDTVETFLSRTLGLGLLAGVATGGLGVLVASVLVRTVFTTPPILLGVSLPQGVAGVVAALKLPFLVAVGGLVCGGLGFMAGFGTPVLVLYFEADDRAREIDALLPDAVAYMHAMSISGMNQLEIFEAVADSEDVYGEVAREFQALMQETTYFDRDYRTAMRNRAIETPSENLSGFLTDMLSISNSGGDMTRFLSEKVDQQFRDSRRSRENALETLELLGEMYMTVSLLPVLLIILLVIMSMMGSSNDLLMYGAIYGLIPVTGALFTVMVAIFKTDDRGGGLLRSEGPSGLTQADTGPFDRSITAEFTDRGPVFDDIYRRETRHRVRGFLAEPFKLLVWRPTYTLLVTVPLAMGLVGLVLLSGVAPTTMTGLESAPVVGTALYFYLPLYVVAVPLALARYGQRSRERGVLDELAPTLRKLSSANDTGLTLLESFGNVADTSNGRLAREFDRIHVKVLYGAPLKDALIEFNNRYTIPRLARLVNLIAEAQEASNQITDVLRTAAMAAETGEEIERERVARTRMQIAIIVITYLVLLGVMALLKVQFLEALAGLVAQAGGGGGGGGGEGFTETAVNVDRLSLLFFHAVTLQALSAAFVAGYLRESSLLGAVKYLVALPTVALVVWIGVG